MGQAATEFESPEVLMTMFRSRVSLFAPLVVCLLCCATATQAASPSLGGTSTRGPQRGTEVEVVLTGGQLDDAQEILFYEPGTEVANFEVVNRTTGKVLPKISPECSLG